MGISATSFIFSFTRIVRKRLNLKRVYARAGFYHKSHDAVISREILVDRFHFFVKKLFAHSVVLPIFFIFSYPYSLLQLYYERSFITKPKSTAVVSNHGFKTNVVILLQKLADVDFFKNPRSFYLLDFESRTVVVITRNY